MSSAQTRYGTVALVGGTGGGATISGQITYTLTNSLAAVQNLALGQTLTDTFKLTTADGTTRIFTVTIHGADGRPINGTDGNNVLAGTLEKETIDGRAGNDVISGSLQGDRLIGGTGNDIYVLGAHVPGSISDTAGADTVISSISRSLAPYASVENLTLTGTAAINGTGNALANTVIGNSAANIISGLGGNDRLDGRGDGDRMTGGAGNDVYFVDNPGDIVSESGGSGADTVVSTITFSLANTARVIGAVENLTLGGSATIAGTGNALNNTIVGNAAANVLNGAAGNDLLSGGAGNDRIYGGPGNDTLYGGAGNGVFVFDTPPNAATNRDAIGDFANAAGNNDTIWLENAIFTKLTATGGLNPAFFRAGAAALDSNDYIVYNKTTGALFYDANGSAAGGAVHIATLTSRPTLTASDLWAV